jgi:hypothetical protein
MSVFDTIGVNKKCGCHIDEILANRKCVCGSYYGEWDDDMCRICESIHCECSVDDPEWARHQWVSRELRHNRLHHWLPRYLVD